MNVPSADSRRRYGSRSKVEDLVHQFQQSGRSAEDFAAHVGFHLMSVQRRIRVSSTQASVPDSKPRFIPVQLRQPYVASPHASSGEIINPSGWRLRFPMTVDSRSLAPLIDILRRC